MAALGIIQHWLDGTWEGGSADVGVGDGGWSSGNCAR